MHSRLQQLFGSASPWLLQPRRSGCACLIFWLLTLPLTWHHPWLAFFGFIAIWSLTVAVWLEAPLLQAFPLPPLTVLLIGLCIRWGVGPLLLAVGGSGDNSFIDIWIRYGPPAQILWMIFTAALLILALVQRPSIVYSQRSQPRSIWLAYAIGNPRFRTRLTMLARVLSIYIAFYIVLSLFSGAFDRQFETYSRWTHQLWRLDTPVAALSRLRDIWFLLLPLWFKLLTRPWRCLLLAELSAFVGLALLSGSRGLLFYPCLMLFFGLWFVLKDPRPLRYIATVLAVLVFVLSPLIVVVRDSAAFQRADNWLDRMNSVVLTLSRPEPVFNKARWLGRDLYACHDPYLFRPDNISLPPAGSENLSNLLYLWTPKHVMPKRPLIFDGHTIAKKLGRAQDNAWTDVWFPCFSLPADLFRRWSLSGVLIGSLLIASLIHILIRLWYRNASISSSTFQILLMLLPATYLQSFPFGTVLETSWALFWELPKYLLIFWVLGACIDRYTMGSEP